MSKSLRISEAEWDVMQVLWEDGPCNAAEVIKPLTASRGWNHRTVRTLLARLVEKGALAYDVDGTRYIYRPAISRRHCVRQESRSFAEKVFGGDVGALLVHFVNDAPLSPEDIAQLRALLDQKQTREESDR